MAKTSEPLTLVRGRAGPLDPELFKAPASGVAELKGDLKKALGAEIPAHIRFRCGLPHIKLRLGRKAPPGTHSATLKIDQKTQPISIEIPTKPRLRLTPPSLDFVGATGERATAEFYLENRGNSPAELPAYAVTGAFASDGVATALSSTYELDTDEPREMFDNFILRLRNCYAGLIRMRFKGTKNPIMPGELRKVTAAITIPTRKSCRGDLQLGKGRQFHMNFEFAKLHIVARITIG